VSEILDFQIREKKLSLLVNVDSSVPKLLFSDEKRLKQILFNLLGNSIKFTFKGSIEINIKFSGEFLLTKIKDTGIGIKKQDINKLFKFFGKLCDAK
jgi:signal transduction histidine kinase